MRHITAYLGIKSQLIWNRATAIYSKEEKHTEREPLYNTHLRIGSMHFTLSGQRTL